MCCDKYTVRVLFKQQDCENILSEFIKDGFNTEDIPFDDLPDKFVIKVTHGSTFNIICQNKLSLAREEVICKRNKWIKAIFLPCYGEWYYSQVKSRIIVKKNIGNKKEVHLCDYKVFCFNGDP